LTTSGIGVIGKGINISGKNAKPGNMVLINGTIGDHGIAVMSARNDFKLTSNIKSDCAPLNELTSKIISTCGGINVLRDPTRGGVATTLNEIAAASNVGIIIEERLIPLKKEVKAACELLGFDPLYVANEGKLLAIAPGSFSNKVLSAMKNDRHGKEASVIGMVVKSPKGVWLKTNNGALRPLIMLEGEQLPRIC